MIVDTHCHLNFQAFDKDRDEVLERADKSGVAMIVVGANFKSSMKAVEIANQNKNVFSSIGLHPTHLIEQMFEEEGSKIRSKAEKFDFSAYEELALNTDVKAIGECGIDYYHINPDVPIEEQKDLQKKVMLEHIDLASKQNLPLILHCRDGKGFSKEAYNDLLEIIIESKKKVHGVLHCFSSDWETAEKFLDLGFYLGFTGIITYTQSLDMLDVVRRTPKDKILSETDCPYLTPIPYQGKRNEPIYVEYVIKKIADIREIDYKTAAKLTLRNAKRLFNLEIGN